MHNFLFIFVAANKMLVLIITEAKIRYTKDAYIITSSFIFVHFSLAFIGALALGLESE